MRCAASAASDADMPSVKYQTPGLVRSMVVYSYLRTIRSNDIEAGLDSCGHMAASVPVGQEIEPFFTTPTAPAHVADPAAFPLSSDHQSKSVENFCRIG